MDREKNTSIESDAGMLEKYSTEFPVTTKSPSTSFAAFTSPLLTQKVKTIAPSEASIMPVKSSREFRYSSRFITHSPEGAAAESSF